MNGEEYEFTIIASKIEKFKILLSQTMNSGLICKPCSIHGLRNGVWSWTV
jgi:hypothetical protein